MLAPVDVDVVVEPQPETRSTETQKIRVGRIGAAAYPALYKELAKSHLSSLELAPGCRLVVDEVEQVAEHDVHVDDVKAPGLAKCRDESGALVA